MLLAQLAAGDIQESVVVSLARASPVAFAGCLGCFYRLFGQKDLTVVSKAIRIIFKIDHR